MTLRGRKYLWNDLSLSWRTNYSKQKELKTFPPCFIEFGDFFRRRQWSQGSSRSGAAYIAKEICSGGRKQQPLLQMHLQRRLVTLPAATDGHLQRRLLFHAAVTDAFVAAVVVSNRRYFGFLKEKQPLHIQFLMTEQETIDIKITHWSITHL